MKLTMIVGGVMIAVSVIAAQKFFYCKYCGAKRVFDDHSLLDGPVFALLADEKVFNDYTLDYETLTWRNGEVDIAPEFVYEHSEKV